MQRLQPPAVCLPVSVQQLTYDGGGFHDGDDEDDADDDADGDKMLKVGRVHCVSFHFNSISSQCLNIQGRSWPDCLVVRATNHDQIDLWDFHKSSEKLLR